jgi:hypothetical protein
MSRCLAERLFTRPLTTFRRTECRLVSGDLLVVTLDDARLAGVGLAAGRTRWTTATSPRASSVDAGRDGELVVPSADAAGLLHIGLDDGHLGAIDPMEVPATGDGFLDTWMRDDDVALASPEHGISIFAAG